MSIIDTYLATLDEPQQAALSTIRAIIKELVPNAVEGMTYGVPGFTYNGHFFMGFAATKKHLSLYPGSTSIKGLNTQLAAFERSKGTIKFTAEKPLPEVTLRAIVLARLAEVQK